MLMLVPDLEKFPASVTRKLIKGCFSFDRSAMVEFVISVNGKVSKTRLDRGRPQKEGQDAEDFQLYILVNHS